MREPDCTPQCPGPVATGALRAGSTPRKARGSARRARACDAGGIAIVRSFPPVARSDARVLILGSMPGAASLAAGQYYGHPRNAFWPILAALLGFDARAPYARRLARLRAARIALWDVLDACTRTGSLDARIVRGSEAANDFARFFVAHPRLTHVFFNGAMAESCFRRCVLPGIGRAPLALLRLPSTSPAHAARSFEQKLAAWRRVLAALREPPACVRRRARVRDC